MANVCVIGLGRIGLPLALILARAGHIVIGVDVDSRTLRKIRNNCLDWPHAEVEKTLIENFLNKSFFVTDNLHEALCKSDVVFIAIGTSIGLDGAPDLSNLFALFGDICSDSNNVKGKLFVIKSTLPVGASRKIAIFIEKKTSLRCSEDFFLAFCPERVLGDKAIKEMEYLPKIIGGMDKIASERTARIYKSIGGKIIIVDKPEIAELVKLVDNAYRQTMFAFANDLALLAEKYGINAYELVKVANDGYPRNNIPFPSAGVSGYCLTKDPLYLETAFKDVSSKRGFPSVWYCARKTNDYMPKHVVEILQNILLNLGKDLKNANILVCGITYKENTDDIRYSHGLAIAAKLKEKGANVFIWDPLVKEREGINFHVVTDPEEVVKKLDALIFTVKHNDFVQLAKNDAILLMLRKMRIPILIDGWGIFQKLIGHPGIIYAGVGIPYNR